MLELRKVSKRFSGIVAVDEVSFTARPGVDLRFSFDGRGERWTEPYTLVKVTSSKLNADSCGYTSLHALDAHSFLIAYSWFRRPGTDDREHKAILIRHIEVR